MTAPRRPLVVDLNAIAPPTPFLLLRLPPFLLHKSLPLRSAFSAYHAHHTRAHRHSTTTRRLPVHISLPGALLYPLKRGGMSATGLLGVSARRQACENPSSPVSGGPPFPPTLYDYAVSSSSDAFLFLGPTCLCRVEWCGRNTRRTHVKAATNAPVRPDPDVSMRLSAHPWGHTPYSVPAAWKLRGS